MNVTLRVTPVALVLLVGACGGAAPDPTPAAGGGDRPAADDRLIPDEKYEEIESTFARKTGAVSRCYAESVDSGDLERSEKGHVTVGLTINPDGSSSHVRIMESSFKSSKVGDCVVRMVSGWTFTTLPKPLETSHTYVLDPL